jgi:hypothetical protein
MVFVLSRNPASLASWAFEIGSSAVGGALVGDAVGAVVEAAEEALG